ncbi:STAS domain-containing protein [Planobispora siamensis]|uniref:STAS domain-containing protein n=1 Tax=Planobispora siamensis TaxID=936338 RepID=A0A8J3SMM4_9ACTN|nr:STAS domain-containing protein [Planobispora siamensis]GIH95109.1 hypothetical protein Psi01_57390 [Planobispora siamensis]
MQLHEHAGGVLIARVRGALAVGLASLLGRQLAARWTQPGLRALVVDVSAVAFADPIGVRELIEAYNRCQAHELACALVGEVRLARLLRATAPSPPLRLSPMPVRPRRSWRAGLMRCEWLFVIP